MKTLRALKDLVVMVLIGLIVPCLSPEAGLAIFENLEKNGYKIYKK